MSLADQLDLVLVSTSPHRRRLMERLGAPFRILQPVCDEEALKRKCRDAQEIALCLSVEKAQSVRKLEPNATLIGSDQVVCLGSEILGKPQTLDRACLQLGRLSGNQHEVVTGLAVIHGNEVFTHVEVAKMQMRHLSTEQIKRYLLRDKPFDCAGAYRLESSGITLFESISTADHSSISGLPLLQLVRILVRLGLQVP